MGLSAEDVFDELFKLAPEKVKAVKEVRESRRSPTARLPPPPCLGPRVMGGHGGGGETGPQPAPAGCCEGRGRAPGPPSREAANLSLGSAFSRGQAIMTFINQKMEGLGLSVQDLDTQVGARRPGRDSCQGRGPTGHWEPPPHVAWGGVGASPLRA